jgi:two-component sensor histidine kinase
LNKTKYASTLERIINHDHSYSDLSEFLFQKNLNEEVTQTRKYNFIHDFVRKEPEEDKINLDYVILKYYVISHLRNEISLEEATRENEHLKKYIEQYKDDDIRCFQIAKAYSSIHDIVFNFIQEKNEESKKICLDQLAVSEILQDTMLMINLKYYYSEVLMNENKIDEYIRICMEIKALDSKPIKSNMYEANMEHLLDALIYKGNYDEAYIEELLHTIYQSAASKYMSYYYYNKYLESLPIHTAAQTRILNQFGVKTISALSDTMSQHASQHLNLNEQYMLSLSSANLLMKYKEYEKAFLYIRKCLALNKKIYSQELAQTIADAQTRELNYKKEAQLNIVRNKNNLLILVSFILFVFLLVLSFLLFKLRKKSALLELRNKENEVLVKEIHHRVKNNFQTISSLLTLQANHSDNENTLDKINEIKSRIDSMMLIHQELDQTSFSQQVVFKSYSQQLINHILTIYKSTSTEVKIEMNHFKFNINTVIPLGLILNEFTTNACKYAFPNSQNGKIYLRVEHVADTTYKMIFKDNGKQPQSPIDVDQTKTLGLKLIQMLSQQLRGSFEYEYNDGVQFTVIFKDIIKH